MEQKTEMKAAESRNLRARSEEEASLIPPVDICEDAEGITLVADMPGVSRERLNIQIDGDKLSIDGEASIDMPEGMEALFAEVRATHFRRSFTLSRELETDKINAQMKDGVLTLKIPKRAELQPRKIEVSAG
ncbi:MAG: Hsp20/alpha crystallin family protein [Gammaproteobacteria bacterium]|jgi:HSP20 family molecular chaperone IbpA